MRQQQSTDTIEMVGVDLLLCPEYGDRSCCTDNSIGVSAAMIVEADPCGLICHHRLFTVGGGHQITFVLLQDFFGIVMLWLSVCIQKEIQFFSACHKQGDL